jgi:hypothetical protein
MNSPTLKFTRLGSFVLSLLSLATLVASSGCTTAGFSASEWKPDPGFESLFNGHDLTGWQYKGGDTFDGKPASTDNRFTVADGIMTAHDRDRRTQPIRQLWTVREFPTDFILRLEFRAGVNADSGIFVRSTQLQCRDYLIAGPYKNLKLYKPQDWNQIEIVVHGQAAHCTCNGELLENAMKIAADGGIGLEADRGPTMDYRHIEIKELK